MKNKGCFSFGTSDVKGEIERKFSKSNFFQIMTFYGAWRSGDMKSSDFTAKGTSLRKSTLFEPFCVKVVPHFVINIHGIRGYKGHVNNIAISQIEIKYHKANTLQYGGGHVYL